MEQTLYRFLDHNIFTVYLVYYEQNLQSHPNTNFFLDLSGSNFVFQISILNIGLEHFFNRILNFELNQRFFPFIQGKEICLIKSNKITLIFSFSLLKSSQSLSNNIINMHPFPP